jgi:NADPH2:quinone reductase
VVGAAGGAAKTRAVRALLATGRVTPAIGQRMPLARAADAHEAMARRAVIGKTVLTT